MKNRVSAWSRLLGIALSLAIAPLLLSCEGASEVQDSANKYDNSDKDQLQKQLQDAQQQQQQQQQQQELLKRLQQDCENNTLLEPRPGPVRVSETGTSGLLLLADLQLAWGGGGGGGNSGGGKDHDHTNCP